MKWVVLRSFNDSVIGMSLHCAIHCPYDCSMHFNS